MRPSSIALRSNNRSDIDAASAGRKSIIVLLKIGLDMMKHLLTQEPAWELIEMKSTNSAILDYKSLASISIKTVKGLQLAVKSNVPIRMCFNQPLIGIFKLSFSISLCQ
jgi:hypothetical protein